MTGLLTILFAAMLPIVPLPRGAVTNVIAGAEDESATWEATGSLPLPYAEARARLLTSLSTAKWRLKQTVPMHTQGVHAEILVFEQPGNRLPLSTSTSNLDPAPISLYFTLQSSGPVSVDFNYRRDFKKGTEL